LDVILDVILENPNSVYSIAVCKVDKLPVIQSNTEGNVNVGGKYQTTKEMEGKVGLSRS